MKTLEALGTSLVVQWTPCFHCRGLGFNPSLRKQDPESHKAEPKKKKKEFERCKTLSLSCTATWRSHTTQESHGIWYSQLTA